MLAAACGDPARQETSVPPDATGLPEGFAGSAACEQCHPDRFDSWHASGHAYSLREADERTVAGRFDGTPVAAEDLTVTPFTLGDGYFMLVESQGAVETGEFRVSRVVGRTFEQGYLTQDDQGAWRLLPLSWSLERDAWDFSHRVLADIAGLPEDKAMAPRNVSALVFNEGCGECHATAFDPGWDPAQKRFDTRLAEGAVACESCHGPGASHLAWHRAERPVGEGYAWPARLLHPAEDLDAKGVMDLCGRCHFLHEWRFAIDDDPRVPHADIALTRNFQGQGFFADGRAAGLIYHGTTQSQSPCFLQGGMSCLHCHDMHSGRRRLMRWDSGSDRQCSECHAAYTEDPVAHSHHEKATCVDCHMPKLVSGALHFLHDHSLSSPEPAVTERHPDVPNACGVCHADRDAAWAREWKDRWWRPVRPELLEDLDALSSTGFDDAAYDARRRAIAADPGRRMWLRLTALQKAPLDPARLSDPDPQVRQVACEIFSSGAPVGEPEVAGLVRLLEDPVRTVRLEAAYALARVGWRPTGDEARRAFADAQAMRRRQVLSEVHLVRIVAISDLCDEVDEVERAYGEWRAVTAWAEPKWSAPSLEVAVRRGRRLLEAGDAAGAATFLTEVRAHVDPSASPGDPFGALCDLDLADAHAASGREAEARVIWTGLSTAPQVMARAIARSRLAGEPTAPAPASPAATDGEFLRRLRPPGP